MVRNILLTVISSAALLMGIAGSTAEADRWNHGFSRRSIHPSFNGAHGRNRGNDRREFQRYYNNFGSFGSRNRLRYPNPYQSHGVYSGPNNGGFYFRY